MLYYSTIRNHWLIKINSILELFVSLIEEKTESMNTQEFRIDLPSDILLSLNETEGELKQNIKLAIAMRWYILKKLTLGKAAQVAGLSRYEFENALAEHNISISNLSVEDVLGDAQKLQ